MKTIIVPTNFSEDSINAVHFAASVALEIKADLALYHAIPDKVRFVADMTDEYEDTETEEALANLNTLKNQLKKYGGDNLPIKNKIEVWKYR